MTDQATQEAQTLPDHRPAVAGQVERAVMRPVEDDRPLVVRLLQALPEQPPTPYSGWARYKNECADFVDRLRAALADSRGGAK